MNLEHKAKLSADMRARWASNRAAMVAVSKRGGANRAATNPNRKPLVGTPERNYFEKVYRAVGAKEARRQIGRLTP